MRGVAKRFLKSSMKMIVWVVQMKIAICYNFMYSYNIVYIKRFDVFDDLISMDIHITWIIHTILNSLLL